jgi:myo-inositol-1-phosphate synthase
MRMEFTWHGCDSALAAPLVLDLARLAAAAHRAGRVGPLPELAFFFKDPIGDVAPGLVDQWATLVAFVAGLGEGGRAARA